MGPLGVVFGSPALDDSAGMTHVDQPVFVEACVAEAIVKAFHIGVLDGLEPVCDFWTGR